MPSTTSITRPSRSSRQSKTTCIPGKLECAAQAKILAQKRRIPLATKYNVNTNGAAAPATTRISLPARFRDRCWVKSTSPPSPTRTTNLTGVPAEYIRDLLPSSTSSMRAALQAVKTSGMCSSSLPKELEIIMNDTVAAACPTHMLAVYNDAPLGFGQKRHVSLFPHARPRPARALRSASRHSRARSPPHPPERDHPRRPLLPPITRIVPAAARIPLHTQQPAIPPRLTRVPLRIRIRPAPARDAREQIHGLWRNACTLGVVDSQLYDVIEASWEHTLSAMQACS
ncbi:hypothetical protein B0H14DRAFT_3502307 [Mycena olivaceomarginata]|nr:hypothetical protein B0H14DRAFT_3502307 [Mycena olivaceomarginata]